MSGIVYNSLAVALAFKEMPWKRCATLPAGLTPLHQAVLDGNLAAVTLLIEHGADVNRQDEDTWTPLHAACAEGHADVAEYLIQKGADKTLKTEDGERPIDLVDPTDFDTISVMLRGQVGQGQCDDDGDDDTDDAVDSGQLKT
ncbi:protein phosphatase 1 regulatory subunit 27-like isoform X2 [Liolophura sinensis]|uniref:protein phosphatase 1 regulatory subunit 27-like isoform X2 n=1 Tax=Liolophura sinensis TaxID=3198878 RepID=UPI0031590264